MALDLSGTHRFTPTVHWRRRLGWHGQIAIAQMQDFDYPDYDPSSWLDSRVFATYDDAVTSPLDLLDMLNAGAANPDDGTLPDPAVAEDVRRNIKAVLSAPNVSDFDLRIGLVRVDPHGRTIGLPL
jgi:hypothetical protein